MNQKTIIAAVALVALAAGVWITVSVQKKVGTDLTIDTNTSSYTDGADFRQNVQAIAERMAGLSQYQVLQADSSGRMQAVAPSALAGTTWDFDGLRATTMVKQGSVTTKSTSSTLTAAEVCDSGVIVGAANVVLTLPATTTLFADCLTTNGDSINVPVGSGSAIAGFTLAAGDGGTLVYSASTTISATKGGLLNITRNAASSYIAMLFNADN